MLVLTRQKNESIVIDNTIKVMVVDIRGDKVRLGIEAPRGVEVHREEVWLKLQSERATGTEAGPVRGVSIPAPLSEAVLLATTKPGVLP